MNDLDTRVMMLENECSAIKGAIVSIEGAIKDIALSLKTLTELEIKHQETRDSLVRVWKDIEKQDNRIRTIEYDMPQLKETRGWVVKAIIGVCIAFGMALTGVIFGT